MAAGFVKQYTGGSSSTQTTGTAITITQPAAGNVLIACVAFGSSTAGAHVSSIATTAGTWTLLNNSAQDTTTGNRQEIWIGSGTWTGSSTSVTPTFSASSKWAANVSEWSGLDTVIETDSTNTVVTYADDTTTAGTATVSTTWPNTVPGGNLIIGAMNLAKSAASTDFTSTGGSPTASSALTYKASGATNANNVGMQALYAVVPKGLSNEVLSWSVGAAWTYTWAMVAVRAKARTYDPSASMTGTVSPTHAIALARSAFSVTMTATVVAARVFGFARSSFTATMTATVALVTAKFHTQALSASLSASTVFARTALKTLTSTLSGAVAFVKALARADFAVTMTGLSGALTRTFAFVRSTFAATCTATVALLRSVAKALTSTLTATVTRTRDVSHTLSSTITQTVTRTRAVVHAIATTITAVPALTRTFTFVRSAFASIIHLIPQAVYDSFARANNVSSWGTADDGQTWTSPYALSGTTALAANEGTFTGSTNDQYWTLGTQTWTADGDVLVRWSASAPAGSFYIRVVARSTGSNPTTTDVDGGFFTVGGALIIVSNGSGSAGSNLSWLANTPYWMRMNLAGSTVKLRRWQDGSAEPTTWDLTATSVSNTSAGGVGLYFGLNASGDTISFDHFSFTPSRPVLAIAHPIAATITGTVARTRQIAHAIAATCTATVARTQQIVHTAAAMITGTVARTQAIAHTLAPKLWLGSSFQGYQNSATLTVTGGGASVSGSTAVPTTSGTDYVVKLALSGSTASTVWNGLVDRSAFTDISVWYQSPTTGVWTQLDVDIDQATNGVWSSTNQTLWFKLQATLGASPATDANYRLAWGNANPTAKNTWTNIYPFSDDFTGSSLSGTRWTVNNSATVGVASSKVTITNPATNNQACIYTVPTYANNYAVAAYMQLTQSGGAVASPSIYDKMEWGSEGLPAGSTFPLFQLYAQNGGFNYNVYNSGGSLWAGALASPDDANWHVFTMGLDATGHGYAALDGAAASGPSTTLMTAARPVQLAVAQNSGVSGGQVVADWFKVRPFTATEPTSGLGAIQGTVVLTRTFAFLRSAFAATCTGTVALLRSGAKALAPKLWLGSSFQGYQNSAPLTVTGGGASVSGSTSVPTTSGTDYVVKLALSGSTASTVWNGLVDRSAFTDISVWYQSPSTSAWTQLDVDIDQATNGAWSSGNITVWFKLQASLGASPATDANYRLAWGNAIPTTKNTWANIYPFSDDFPGSNVDGTKWTSTVPASGTISVASSLLTMGYNSGVTGDVYITSVPTYGPSYAFTMSGALAVPVGSASGGPEFRSGVATPFSETNINDNLASPAGGIQVVTDNTSPVFSAILGSVNGTTRAVGTARDSSGHGYGTPGGASNAWTEAPTSQTVTNALPVQILLDYRTTLSSYSWSIDWAKVRPWTPTEPTSSLGTVQGVVQLAKSTLHALAASCMATIARAQQIAHTAASTITSTVTRAQQIVHSALAATLTPAPAPAPADTFSRADQSGWGVASGGSSWAHAGTFFAGTGTPALSISANEGLYTGSTNWELYTLGNALATADADVLVRWRASAFTANGPLFVVLRAIDQNNFYGARITNAGFDYYTLFSGGPDFGGMTGAVPATNTWYWTRIRIVGTTLTGRYWADGDTEPSSWLFTRTRTTLPNGGYVGLFFNPGTTGTTVEVDHFSTTTFQSVPARTTAKALLSTLTSVIARTQDIVHAAAATITGIVARTQAITHTAASTVSAAPALGKDLLLALATFTSSLTGAPSLVRTTLKALVASATAAVAFTADLVGGSVQYAQDLAASCAVTVVTAWATAHALAASCSSSVSTAWQTTTERSATISGSPAIGKDLFLALATFASGMTAAGTLLRATQRVYAVTLLPAAALLRMALPALGARLAAGPTLVRTASPMLRASLAASVGLVRQTTQQQMASLIAVAASAQQTLHGFGSTLPLAADLARDSVRQLLSQSTATAEFARDIATTLTAEIRQTMTLLLENSLLVLSAALNMGTDLGRDVQSTLASTLAALALLGRGQYQQLVSLLGAAAALGRTTGLSSALGALLAARAHTTLGTAHAVPATMSTAASLLRHNSKRVLAQLLPAPLIGRLVRHGTRATLAGQGALARASSITRQATLYLTSALQRASLQALSAALPAFSVVQHTAQRIRALGSTLPVLASAQHATAHGLRSTIGLPALLQRATSAGLEGVLQTIGESRSLRAPIRLALRAWRALQDVVPARSTRSSVRRSSAVSVPARALDASVRRSTTLVAHRLVREDPTRMIAQPARADLAGLYISPYEENVAFTVDMTAALPENTHVSGVMVMHVQAKWPGQPDDAATLVNGFAAGPGLADDKITLVVGDGQQEEGKLYTVVLLCVYDNDPQTTATIFVEIPCSRGLPA